MTEGFRRFNRGTLSVENIAALMEREILALQPVLQAHLALNGYTSYTRGLAEVASSLPSTGLEPLYVGTTAREALGAAVGLFSPLGEPLPSLPALDTALHVLGASRAMQGIDYRATADLVQQGAFALTGTLTERGLQDVKDTLEVAIREGSGIKEFIKTVTTKLEGESLSEAHLENIFRTNTLSLYSDGQFKAVQQPLVKSHFPYASYWATNDKRTRPHHAELEKLGLNNTNIYNVDDPTFLKFRPIWDYNCRCSWHVTTVEQAAAKGVKEAQAWWERALEKAKESNRTPYEMLESVKPATMEYVTPPPFEPDPEFIRM